MRRASLLGSGTMPFVFVVGIDLASDDLHLVVESLVSNRNPFEFHLSQYNSWETQLRVYLPIGLSPTLLECLCSTLHHEVPVAIDNAVKNLPGKKRELAIEMICGRAPWFLLAGWNRLGESIYVARLFES